MATKFRKNRPNRFNVRLDAVSAEHVEDQIKSGRFTTRNEYFVWLVSQHRNGMDEPMQELEAKIASTINRFRSDIRGDIASARRSAELSNASLHALVKMMLVNFPEAEIETRKLAEATAKKRYERLLILATQEYEKDADGDEE